MDPYKLIEIRELRSSQTVLEVGCGTSFFTIPAAEIIGDSDHLVTMVASSGFLKEVANKVQAAGLNNVDIVQKDALNIELDTAGIDKALLLGVIPFPLLPLSVLITEY